MRKNLNLIICVSIVVAVLILLYTDILVLFSDINKNSIFNRELSSWWLTKAYFAERYAPDVVILGDNQLGPLLGSDAYVYDRIVDFTDNHRSYVLEEDLNALLNKKLKVFVAPLSQATTTDQLFVAQAMFSKLFKPRLVVIAISPHNFANSSNNQTEVRAFFSSYRDPESLKNALKGLGEKKHLVDYFNGVTPQNRSPLILNKPFQLISPGQIVICSRDDYSFSDNSKDYAPIYKSLLNDANGESNNFDRQLSAFTSLLAYLKHLDIKVVVFNLPITVSNKQLLPPSFWTVYHDRIGNICKMNNADYISLDKVVLPFQDNEFIDSVHLNLVGGYRLSKSIAVFAANKLGPFTFQELIARDRRLK